MSAAVLLKEIPNPTDEDIDQALTGNIAAADVSAEPARSPSRRRDDGQGRWAMNALANLASQSVPANAAPQFLKTHCRGRGGLLIGFICPVCSQSTAATFAPNAFVRIGTDDSVTVIVNHSEMGQGVFTGAAESSRMSSMPIGPKWPSSRAPVDPVYNHPVFKMQMTGGSTSTWSSFDQFRQAGAAARAMLIAAAAQKWNVDPGTCRTETER